jgi:hypothetical protein
MSKEIQDNAAENYISTIQEIKLKIEVVETALSLINITNDQINYVETIVKEVKGKINHLETRLIGLLETLTKHLKFSEERIIILEKRIHSLEIKDNLVKEMYNSTNLKN